MAAKRGQYKQTLYFTFAHVSACLEVFFRVMFCWPEPEFPGKLCGPLCGEVNCPVRPSLNQTAGAYFRCPLPPLRLVDGAEMIGGTHSPRVHIIYAELLRRMRTCSVDGIFMGQRLGKFMRGARHSCMAAERLSAASIECFALVARSINLHMSYGELAEPPAKHSGLCPDGLGHG